MRCTGGEAIVEILKRDGIEYVFGLCGHGDISMIDALYGSGIEYVSVRNESTAVHMADAYYRTSHKLAAVLVTIGPGLTNTVTAVADAMADGAAMVVIAGDVPSFYIGKGALQEISTTSFANQSEILRPITKWASRVPELALLPDYVYHALNTCRSGMPGPVLVSVPMNFFSEVADFEIDEPRKRRATFQRVQAEPAGVRAAAQLLEGARRPLIFAGNGVVISEATDELIRLAERLECPVATTLVGQGAFPKTHPLNIDCPNSVANPAVAHAIRSADVVLAVGTRLEEIETSGWNPQYSFDPWNGQKFIHVDISPTVIGHNYPVDVGVVGDAKAVLAQLNECLAADGSSGRDAEWLDEIRRLKGEWEATKATEVASDEVPIKTQRLLRDLADVMPEDTIVLVDTGGFGYAVGQHLPIKDPLSFYYNLGIGSMGPCMAGALGAKLANPDRAVVALVGDGGFTCEMAPVVTAAEYAIPVIWIVLNNYSYNSIEAYQHKHYDGRILGTQFRDRQGQPYNPDFVALARACGLEGLRVEDPADLREGLKRAFASERAFVLDVVTAETRFPKTYGFFEMNRIFAEDAESKRERAASLAAAGAQTPAI